MGTQSWSTRIRSDSTATFREWGLELNTKLAAAGLVQTADTGQVNWTTVNQPGGANTEAGYEVWKLNDSLFGTAPVYFRIGYGSDGAGANSPRIEITVGPSTDGAGVITGTALSALHKIHPSANQTLDTARQSYLCVTSGFFGLSWKTGSTSEACFLFCRTVDGAGAITATGGIAYWGLNVNQGTASQAFRYAATPIAFAARSSPNDMAFGMNPQVPSSSQVGSDIQAFLGWTITPQVAPLIGICGVLSSEVSAGSTFTTTLVGSTVRTYIGLTIEAGPFGPSAAGTGYPKFAMLWE